MKASLDPRSLQLRVGLVRTPRPNAAIRSFPPLSILQGQPIRYLMYPTLAAAAIPARRQRLYANTVRASVPTSCTACRTSARAPAPCNSRTHLELCGLRWCGPLLSAAGHLAAYPAACEAAGVPALLTRLGRRLRVHADRGGPEAPQVARGHRRHSLPFPSFSRGPLIRGLGALAFATCPLRACNSYKRAKGRSHTRDKRLSTHPHKPHATGLPSHRLSTDTVL